jgi:hypothetical protein
MVALDHEIGEDSADGSVKRETVRPGWSSGWRERKPLSGCFAIRTHQHARSERWPASKGGEVGLGGLRAYRGVLGTTERTLVLVRARVFPKLPKGPQWPGWRDTSAHFARLTPRAG